MIEKNTNLGSVNISLDVVSTVAGGAATECYGVVGMASQKKLKDGFYELLKKENYSKGIIASDGETGLILDLYIILGYGIKINEILVEVQKKVKKEIGISGEREEKKGHQITGKVFLEVRHGNSIRRRTNTIFMYLARRCLI